LNTKEDSQARKLQEIRERRKKDINTLMSMPEGRRFIRLLLSEEVTRYYMKCIGVDQNNTSYLAGKNSIGVDIISLLLAGNDDNMAILLTKAKEDM
jgi:hypothetical protein